MLGCEHPHGRPGKVEFGSDGPVCHGQRGYPVCGRKPPAALWLGERVLVEHEYAELGKAARSLVLHYFAKMTGLSRTPRTRLIA